MKTKINFLITFLFACNFIYAQTTVTIQGAFNTPPSPSCPPPFVTTPYMYGAATGYLVTDSLDMYFNFGDGNDTTVTVPLDSGNSFFAYINHSYAASGQYSLQYIATGPDGNADTLINYNQIAVGDTCGNISGTIYIDANSNCIYDAGDTPVPMAWGRVELLSGPTVVAWAYTNSQGNYSFNVPTGLPYTVQTGNLFNSFTVLCPSSGNYSIPTAPSSGNDFAMTCSPGFDLLGQLHGWGFRPNQQPATITLGVWNARCMPVSGQVRLVLDPLVTFTSSIPSPASINGDTLTWNFTNLVNYNFNYWWNSILSNVYVMTSASAVLGDTLCFTVIAEPVAGDANPSNNVVTVCYEVRNSWDPNDKSVNPVGVEPGGRISPDVNVPLTYTVRFQNTGNDTAYNVFIMDTIDSDLDMNTFHVLSTSHPMDVDIYPGNAVKFSFNNIMLPDSGANQSASNGFVSYSINQEANLANGTVINNTANIYFDFNPAVVTNTTVNTIDTDLPVSVGEESSDETSFTIYPNPATAELTINFGKAASYAVQLCNMLGEVLEQTQINSASLSLNISSYTKGIYFITVTDDPAISGAGGGNKLMRKVVKM